ncbi:MAG TPA: GDSL-type esterase/lipase family protein, partial [Polyangiaceae bacterium]|nr:GDSL-type esterase/lipase family protein [Polyangiaceae bacterium]
MSARQQLQAAAWCLGLGWLASGGALVLGCEGPDADADSAGGSGGATTGLDGSGGLVNGVGGSGGSTVGLGGATAGGSGGSSSGSSSGGAPGSGGQPVTVGPLTVFLAGDSTVSNYANTAAPGEQAGWGQMLPEFFAERIEIDNRAVGGRTSRRFIDEGRLDAIWADAVAGDYLFVQFGTNDSNKSATYELNGTTYPYYLDPASAFPAQLSLFIDGARERGVVPVLVTPPPRNSAYCTGGNGTGAYAQAMRDLGASDDVLVLDLNARAVAYLKAICPSPTPEDFFFLRSNGTVDGTHFQENGARFLASWVA